MKVHTEYLKFHTRNHREYAHITPQVETIVKKSGIKEGMVLVSAMQSDGLISWPAVISKCVPVP